MKSVVALVFAAALGAGVFWVFQRLSVKEERALPPELAAPDGTVEGLDVPPATRPPGATKPTLIRRPIFSPTASREENPGAVGVAAEDPAPPSVPPVSPPPASPPAESGSSRIVPATLPALEGDRALARAAFDSGDRKRGIRLLEDLFHAAKDRPDVDLSQEAMRLLEVETKLDSKREFLLYLARFDRSGRVLDDQLARAARHTATADDSAAAAIAAWDELTLAYEVVPDRTQRKRVFSQVSTFLERMLFSGRYTPLLTSYTIQPGDSLSGIAAKFQTTQDSLRRINGLKSDVIQPRQRLRILPGKLRIFVDKSEFLLWATLDDRIFLELPVGIGRDNATPIGKFAIRVRQKDPAWWRPGEPPIPAGAEGNILGSRWLGFQETQDFAGFGIHGTSDPSSLGKESSAGCIRLRNEDINLLYDFVTLGTEVVIKP